MLTVLPPFKLVPNLKVTVAFCVTIASCWSSLTRYRFEMGSYSIPNASSKARQAAVGSHMCGTVESMSAEMPPVRSCSGPFELVTDIA